jgi:hypothetical protein
MNPGILIIYLQFYFLLKFSNLTHISNVTCSIQKHKAKIWINLNNIKMGYIYMSFNNGMVFVFLVWYLNGSLGEKKNHAREKKVAI